MTWEVRESLLKLRWDAIERKMSDLELMYGASVIRLGWEVIDQYLTVEERRISGEIASWTKRQSD